jgi:hypothetical protein
MSNVVPSQVQEVPSTSEIPTKTEKDINEEYKKHAAMVGDKEFRKKLLEVEIDQEFMAMNKLCLDLQALKNAEKTPDSV